MKLTPEQKQKFLQKEPEDQIDEIIQSLILENNIYQEVLVEANKTTKLWKARYQACSQLIDPNSIVIADQLATQLQLIVSQVKPKFNNQKQIFADARMALEAYNQHKEIAGKSAE